jgi:hypothetical protein
MTGRPHSAIAALLGVLLICGAVRAETRDQAAAEALFRAGRAAMTAGDYETGLARFQESLRLESSPGALLNQAICEAELGQLTNAWRDYRKVLELVPESDGRARIAVRRLEGVEKRLSWLTISAAPNASKDARIVLDDVAFAAANLDVALPMDPGRHELEVTVPGHRRRDYVVTLREGEHRSLSVLPGPRDSILEVPVSSQRGTRTRSGPPTAGYVLLGTGAVGLTVAAVTGVLLLDRLATVDENCQDKLCNEIGLDAARSGRMLRAVTAVAVSVGVVAGGIGGYLILSNTGNVTEVAWRGTF